MTRRLQRVFEVITILCLIVTVFLMLAPERPSGVCIYRITGAKRLRYLGLASHNWSSHNTGHLNVHETESNQDQPIRSWSTELLPFLDQKSLYERIDLEQPWNSEDNREWFQIEVESFQNPDAGSSYDTKDSSGYGLTHFATNSRVATSKTIDDLDGISRADGQGNTLMHGEVAGNFMPWGQPGNWRDPAIGLNTSLEGFGSHDDGSVAFLFWDGHFRELSADIDPTVLRAMATPDGREAISHTDY